MTETTKLPQPVPADYPPYQGSLTDRYNIYVEAMKSMGLPFKSFDEWLDS